MTTTRPYGAPEYAPNGFEYVTQTPEETQDYRDRNNGAAPSVYRVICLECGRRMWGSGLGIGSHRRSHKRSREATR